MSERQLILILASIAAITPLAIDMYLPAIKSMEVIFNATNAKISTSVSIFFVGLALGQIIGGPISDAYGRYPIVVFGLSIFSLASFGLLFIDSVEMLWFLRFIQAFGGGVATVNVSATVKDLFSGAHSARIFSLIGSITILAPLLAPVIGLVIMLIFDDYRVIFMVLLLYSLGTLYFYRKLFKAQHENNIVLKITPIKNYIGVLTSGKPMLMILALVISSSGIFSVIISSSFIYTSYFKLSSTMYIIFFSLNVIIYLGIIKINIRALRFNSPMKLLKFGALSQAFCGVMLMILKEYDNVYIFAIFIALYVGVVGFIYGNGLAIVLDYFPKTSASANAVMGSLQYIVGSLSGFLAVNFNDGTLFSVTLTLLCTSVLGTTILMATFRGKKGASNP